MKKTVSIRVEEKTAELLNEMQDKSRYIRKLMLKDMLEKTESNAVKELLLQERIEETKKVMQIMNVTTLLERKKEDKEGVIMLCEHVKETLLAQRELLENEKLQYYIDKKIMEVENLKNGRYTKKTGLGRRQEKTY